VTLQILFGIPFLMRKWFHLRQRYLSFLGMRENTFDEREQTFSVAGKIFRAPINSSHVYCMTPFRDPVALQQSNLPSLRWILVLLEEQAIDLFQL